MSMYVVPSGGGVVFIWASSAKEAQAIVDEQEKAKGGKK